VFLQSLSAKRVVFQNFQPFLKFDGFLLSFSSDLYDRNDTMLLHNMYFLIMSYVLDSGFSIRLHFA